MSLLIQRSDLKMSAHELVGPASYVTGGIAFEPKDESGNPSSLAIVLVDCDNATYEGRYNYTAGKLVAIVRATGAEVASAVDLSAVTFKLLAIYR